jgi:hypothetical protein
VRRRGGRNATPGAAALALAHLKASLPEPLLTQAALNCAKRPLLALSTLPPAASSPPSRLILRVPLYIPAFRPSTPPSPSSQPCAPAPGSSTRLQPPLQRQFPIVARPRIDETRGLASQHGRLPRRHHPAPLDQRARELVHRDAERKPVVEAALHLQREGRRKTFASV